MTMLHTEAQRRKRSEGGFTLVELLVVIVIIGILAAVAVFAVAGITDKGEENACAASANSLTTASEAFFAQNSAYAANLNALQPTFINLSDVEGFEGGTDDDFIVGGQTITYTPGATTSDPPAITDDCDDA